MAGYCLYSLDWNKFSQFVAEPTDEQLLEFADFFSQEVDQNDGEFDDDDPVADWPADPAELKPYMAELLRKEDWYGELSDVGKCVLEAAIQEYCTDDSNPLGFRVDSDGVYWPVIDFVRAHFNVPADTVTEAAISRFGLVPFRFVPELNKRMEWGYWFPIHSMHPPDEVKKLLEETQAAEADVMNSNDENAKFEYEDQLVPALTRILNDNRLLFIHVDT